MGSKEITKLQYRQSFAFIGVVGDPSKAQEQIGKDINNADTASATQVFLVRVDKPKDAGKPPSVFDEYDPIKLKIAFEKHVKHNNEEKQPHPDPEMEAL